MSFFRNQWMGRPCWYCGQRSATSHDHLTPRDRGGDDSPENLVPACTQCNSRKHTKTLEEFRWHVGFADRTLPKVFWGELAHPLEEWNDDDLERWVDYQVQRRKDLGEQKDDKWAKEQDLKPQRDWLLVYSDSYAKDFAARAM